MAYRGKNLRVTNVIFTQGSYDPYKTLGLTRTISELNPVVVIDGIYLLIIFLWNTFIKFVLL